MAASLAYPWHPRQDPTPHPAPAPSSPLAWSILRGCAPFSRGAACPQRQAKRTALCVSTRGPPLTPRCSTERESPASPRVQACTHHHRPSSAHRPVRLSIMRQVPRQPRPYKRVDRAAWPPYSDERGAPAHFGFARAHTQGTGGGAGSGARGDGASRVCARGRGGLADDDPIHHYLAEFGGDEKRFALPSEANRASRACWWRRRGEGGGGGTAACAAMCAEDLLASRVQTPRALLVPPPTKAAATSSGSPPPLPRYVPAARTSDAAGALSPSPSAPPAGAPPRRFPPLCDALCDDLRIGSTIR